MEGGSVGSGGGRSISVLLADDDAGERGKLAELLSSAGFEVLETSKGDEALAIARARLPAVTILEIPLEVLSGYEVCRALKAEFGPRFAVVFLSRHRTESYDRVAGLLLGADDYLVKPYAADELLARIRLLAPRSRATDPLGRPRLTPREEQILGLLADGLRQFDIAARLGISSRTVGTHIEHILSKLGVHSRAQAVALALRIGGPSSTFEARLDEAAAVASPDAQDEDRPEDRSMTFRGAAPAA
jgi:DNA-binding NarL/FixJ family response regulator